MTKLKLILYFTVLIIHLKSQAPLIYLPKNTDFAVGQISYDNPNYRTAGTPPNITVSYPAGFVSPAAPVVV